MKSEFRFQLSIVDAGDAGAVIGESISCGTSCWLLNFSNFCKFPFEIPKSSQLSFPNFSKRVSKLPSVRAI